MNDVLPQPVAQVAVGEVAESAEEKRLWNKLYKLEKTGGKEELARYREMGIAARALKTAIEGEERDFAEACQRKGYTKAAVNNWIRLASHWERVEGAMKKGDVINLRTALEWLARQNTIKAGGDSQDREQKKIDQLGEELVKEFGRMSDAVEALNHLAKIVKLSATQQKVLDSLLSHAEADEEAEQPTPKKKRKGPAVAV